MPNKLTKRILTKLRIMQKTATLKSSFKVTALKALLCTALLITTCNVLFAQKLLQQAAATQNQVEYVPGTDVPVAVTNVTNKKVAEAKGQETAPQLPARKPAPTTAVRPVFSASAATVNNNSGFSSLVAPTANTSNTSSAICTTTGSLVATDLNLTSRPNRSGVATTCAALPACGAPLVGGPFYADTVRYYNFTCLPKCVTVSYVATAGAGNVFVTAYQNSINFANLCANRLGDGGLSSLAGATTDGATVTFSFTAPAGSSIVFLINNANASLATTGYSVVVDGIDCTPPTCSPATGVLSQALYQSGFTNIINEDFSTATPPATWPVNNLSTPVGTTGWFAGSGAILPGNSGGFVAANFNNVSGANTISNWLLTPNVTIKNGDVFRFRTRTTSGAFPDRLQVRLSTAGASVNVGTTNASTGDFGTLLLDINPTYTATGYPTAWTTYTLTMSGLPAAGASGRLAFRYFVENGGAGANSDYIGIDDVTLATPNFAPAASCVGSQVNLKVDIVGSDPTYNVVLNAAPGGNFTINNYVSGTSIPVTIAGNVTYSVVSITSTCNPNCVATASGTVVITPAAGPVGPVTIDALPSAPICLGSGTVLTARSGAGSALAFNQTSTRVNAIPAQTFEAINAAFDGAGADDFVVPANEEWTINQVRVTGVKSNAAGVMQGVSVTFYNNTLGNLPGTAILTQVVTPQNFVDNAGNLTINLPNEVRLAAGTYWMGISVQMPFGGNGQWFWGNYGGNVPVGNRGVYQNPGLGFGSGCATWGYINTCIGAGGPVGGGNVNLMFGLNGSIATNSANLPAGSTVTWSPIAGLSNPTSNPVAAAPMMTTNYNALIRFANGCQTAATKTVTINQPADITTEPRDTVACDGGSVRFTVAATGFAGFSGLRYQWQEAVASAPTAWSNLANGGIYAGATSTSLTINPVSAFMNNNRYRCVVTGACFPGDTSLAARLTVNSLPIIPITPAGPVCGGVQGVNGTRLEVGSAPPPVPGSLVVASSATLNLAIPDNNLAGVTTNLTVAGVPANATITGYRVKLNMPHSWVGDVVFALRSPNGNIINLDWYLSGTGGGSATTGMVNTVITSNAANPALSSGVNPFTGSFRSDAAAGTAAAPAGPTGFIPNVPTVAAFVNAISAANANGQWTLGAYDGGPADVGTLTNWELTVLYTTPGTVSVPLTYTWSPIAGLFTNAAATIPYTGTSLQVVYAAPTVATNYTVTAVNAATGCSNTNSVFVNYTPPAPNITPNPVVMCFGDAAVKLKREALSLGQATATSGTLSKAIPEGAFPNRPATAAADTLVVTGVPSGAFVTGVDVTLNITHPYVTDNVIVLKAPNGTVVNLSAIGGFQNNAGANFVNTVISTNGGTNLAAGTGPFTGTFGADFAGATFTVNFPGGPFTLQGGPVGFNPTVNNAAAFHNAVGTTLNGNWTIAMYDAAAPDLGTLTSWSVRVKYAVGVPAQPAVWSPIAGLFTDANATQAYTGDRRDSVYAKPTTIGTTNYTATTTSLEVRNLNTGITTINAVGTANPYPAINNVKFYPTSGVRVDSVKIYGFTHTFPADVDIVLQSPAGKNVVLLSDIGGGTGVSGLTYTFDRTSPLMTTGLNPAGKYRPTNLATTDNWPAPGPGTITQANPSLDSFAVADNVNGDWKLYIVDDLGGDAGSISGYEIFFDKPQSGCPSPSTTIPVTVNQPLAITTQPVAAVACANRTTTFTVAATGTAPGYQWQTRKVGGAAWVNLVNAAPFSGVTTATLTVTNPSVSLNLDSFRVVLTGAAPCGGSTSNAAVLRVNPLPAVVISANPTKLFPGLTTTITSSSTPAAATNVWRLDGNVIAGATAATRVVDINALGNYTLNVTDVNGCTNTSNMLNISDSVSAKVFVYPNPSNGTFQVRYYAPANNRSPRGINIYDAKGNRVYVQNYPNTSAYQQMNVDIRALSNGIYWIEIIDNKGERVAVGRAIVNK
jgi:subtilisin-like proprotein convertase family protein